MDGRAGVAVDENKNDGVGRRQVLLAIVGPMNETEVKTLVAFVLGSFNVLRFLSGGHTAPYPVTLLTKGHVEDLGARVHLEAEGTNGQKACIGLTV